jgi:uncharacterized protein (DUF934 family)
MRRIIRRRELVVDDVRYGGEPPAAGTRAAQPAGEFIASLPAAAGNVVLLAPTDEVETLAPHLHLLQLIVVDFPRIGEGRGFSQARLLRQRYAYRGELRARGALKRDQLLFLARCGFDSFDLDAGEDLQAALGALDSFSVAYQDGSDELVKLQRRASPA